MLSLQVVALILSDVIGDPLDLIASGPTVHSETRPEEVWPILERYGLSASVPESVREVLGKAGSEWRQERKLDEGAGHVLNTVIGSNTIALESAARLAREIGLRPVVLSPGVCGDVCSVAQLYSALARFACAPGASSPDLSAHILQLGLEVGVESWDLCRVMQALSEGRGEGWDATCLLAGGEPTVQLTGTGKGGRNQELALRLGMELGEESPLRDVVFLSGGTDGQDGPTEAAGAVINGRLHEEAQGQGLNPKPFLDNNDSFTFFTQLLAGRHLLLPGLTGTNVMDVHLLLLPTPATTPTP